MFKLLAKQAVLVECGVLESAADAERWIRNRVAAAGAAIAPAGARLLAERCGPDVKRLRNDVERLLLYAMGQKTIELADVREIVGPAALQDDWAMTNAIEAGDGATALRQLALMLDAGLPPEKVLGQLGWLVRSKFPADCARPPAQVDRGGVPHGRRPETDRRRSARAAGTAGGGVVREEGPACQAGRDPGGPIRPAAALRCLRLGDPRRQPRLVPSRRVPVDDPLAGHPVDERDRLLEGRLGGGQVVAVNRGADALQRVPQPGAELPVVLAVLQALPVRFQRRCMTCHVIRILRKPQSYHSWPGRRPFLGSVGECPARRARYNFPYAL